MSGFNVTLNKTLVDFTTTKEFIGERLFEESIELLALILTIYYISYIVSTAICFVSIFIYYLPDNDLLYSLKLSCISCQICYGIGNTAWFINFHCSFVTLLWIPNDESNGSKDICYDSSEVIAPYLMGLGYGLFLYSFWIRLINAFKDSKFEISSSISKKGQIFSIIILLSWFISLLGSTIAHIDANLIYLAYLSILLVILNMIGYISASIIVVKIMFNKIRQFTQFMASNHDTSIIIHGRTNTQEKRNITRDWEKSIKFLTVLYTVALISSTIVLFLIIFFSVTTVILRTSSANKSQTGRNGEGSVWRTNMITYMFYSFGRLLFMIDTTINSLCLLLQNKRARYLYPKLCCCCNKFACWKIY